MPDPTESIAGLLTRVRAGDEEALAELLRRYESKIRLTARHLLRPVLRRYLDSIDIAQSVQFQLMSGLRRGSFELPDTETFVALAVTMVRRKIAQRWRHIQREHVLRFGRPEGEAPESSPVATTGPRRVTRRRRSSRAKRSRTSASSSTRPSAGCWNCGFRAIQPPRRQRKWAAPPMCSAFGSAGCGNA